MIQNLQNVAESLSIAIGPIFQDDNTVQVDEIVTTCDMIDSFKNNENGILQDVRRRALEFKRYELLSKLMRKNYDDYIATASFLAPSRMKRLQLPNLQDVPIAPGTSPVATIQEDGTEFLVADCELDDMKFQENLLDTVLLKVFRNYVKENTGGVSSETPGILGLVEQGRSYMVSQDADAQHAMVRKTLGQLMTPFLPPFYRIFMSGIVPKITTNDGSPIQLGPWFYAPWLTSIVTPPFFGFLVGPSIPNRRKDGRVGGLVVEKCKFLQESNCKGLCLHQCKLPAQQFFKDELGLSLSVSPNFVTQECQWSFGEEPLPPDKDPSFPKGCLVGCESRKQVASMQGATSSRLCSS